MTQPTGELQTSVDPRLPLYHRVRDAMHDEIRQRRPGERLPTEVELMERFGVSRTTVRAAVTELAQAGLLTRRSGSGTFVAEPPIEQELTRLTGFVEDMRALNLRPHARVVTAKPVRASQLVAERLDIARGSEVMLIERVRLANDEPISFDITYLPIEIGLRVVQENLAVYPIFELLESKYGIALGEADYAVEAAAAPRRIANLLGIRSNDAILLINRTTFAKSGEAIDFEQLHYRGDRVRYRLRLMR